MGPVKFLYNSRFDFTENSLVTNTVFITRVLHTFMSLDQSVRLSDCNIVAVTEQNRTEQNFIHVDKHVRSLTGDIRYI